VLKGFASIVPLDADVSAVADAIVKVVDLPFGKRPFRVHIDPTQDGAEVVNAVSNVVPRPFWLCSKSFNANAITFRTVEDGPYDYRTQLPSISIVATLPARLPIRDNHGQN
jgi:hypothetical protein